MHSVLEVLMEVIGSYCKDNFLPKDHRLCPAKGEGGPSPAALLTAMLLRHPAGPAGKTTQK